MNALETALVSRQVIDHVQAIAVCGARVLPVVFLCPFLGGQAAPSSVRVATTGALAIGLHFAGGVALPPSDAWALAAAVLRELVLGLCIGLAASLPFDAARIGGRFIDLFRGTSAEAVLPVSGTRESATGDGLYHLVVTLAVASGASGLLVAALWRSFGAVPLGGFAIGDSAVETLLRLVSSAFVTGFAIGAPIAALSLAVDALLGLASRAAPTLHLSETGAPIRILGGGAAIWLGVGVVCQRLLEDVTSAEGVIRELVGALR